MLRIALIVVALELASCRSSSPALTPSERYVAEGFDVMLCIEKDYPREHPEANGILARRAGSSDQKVIDQYCKRADAFARKNAVPLRRNSDGEITVYVDGDERLCYKQGDEVTCD